MTTPAAPKDPSQPARKIPKCVRKENGLKHRVDLTIKRSVNDDFEVDWIMTSGGGASLPLGTFQITILGPAVVQALRDVAEANDRHKALFESGFDFEDEASIESFSTSADRLRTTQEALTKAWQPSEAPSHLPRGILELYLASLLAQHLRLDFEVIRYELEEAPGGKHFWIVTARIKGNDNIGTSFSFDKSNEEMAQAALLAAYADAYVRCVSAEVPWFPWARFEQPESFDG